MLTFSLTVRCVTCEETFVVNDRAQCGTIVACPHCRAMVEVSEPAIEVAASDDAPPILTPPDEPSHVASPALSSEELLWRRRLFITFLTLTAILVLLLLVSLFIEPPQQVDTSHAPENPSAANIATEPAPQPEPAPEPEPPAEIIPEVIIPETEPPAEVVDVDNGVDDAIDPRDRLRDLLLQTPTPTIFVDRRDEIAARLSVKVASLDVSDVAAIDVARVLESVANVSVTVAPSIAEQRLTLHYATPVSIAEIMQAAAKLLRSNVNCDVVIEWNQVSWRQPDTTQIDARLLQCDDLRTTDDRARLASRVKSLAALDTANETPDGLLCHGTKYALDQAELFLEMLRVARGLPQRTSRSRESLAAESFGWDAMQQPCTLDVFAPMPLEEFLAVLEAASGVRMLIDHAALGAALAPVHTLSGTVSCDGITLDAALTAFLVSLDAAEPLTYRICGERLIEVTTVTASRRAEAFSLELHKMPPTSASNLLHLQQSFRNLDPHVDGSSVDSDGEWLFVRQSQPVQRAIRQRLATTTRTAPTTTSTEELPTTDDGEVIEDVDDIPE